METYSWSKFYPEHCEDKVVSMMISEVVHISWDEIPDANDFVDALITLENMDNRIWLYNEFIEANSVLQERYLSEYLECEGIDDLFRKMMDDSDLELSHDFFMSFVNYGVDEADFPLVLGRYHGKLSGDEAEELFASYTIPNEYAKEILSNRIDGKLSYEQIEEIMNCIDENLYRLMLQHIRKLSFEERIDIMDEFGLEQDEVTIAKNPTPKKSKDEPGKLFSGVAMAAAIVGGIHQGITGKKDDDI